MTDKPDAAEHSGSTDCSPFSLCCIHCDAGMDIEPGPERTVALRKLLEAKDAAVRAKLNPGG